jgi:hypothetical protein
MNTIKYDKSLDIRNVGSLPHGLNCKYLEVITSHIPNVYIAKQWHRTIKNLKTDNSVIVF